MKMLIYALIWIDRVSDKVLAMQKNVTRWRCYLLYFYTQEEKKVFCIQIYFIIVSNYLDCFLINKKRLQEDLKCNLIFLEINRVENVSKFVISSQSFSLENFVVLFFQVEKMQIFTCTILMWFINKKVSWLGNFKFTEP